MMESDDQRSTGSRGSCHGDQEDRDSESYRQKRDRNNLAVKKSREKSRQKTSETATRMAVLRVENERLESKVSDLTKELGIMKELLLAHARGNKAKDGSPSATSSRSHQVSSNSMAASATASSHRPTQQLTHTRSPTITAAVVQSVKKEEPPPSQLVNPFLLPVPSDHENFSPKSEESLELSVDSAYECDGLNTPEIYFQTYND